MTLEVHKDRPKGVVWEDTAVGLGVLALAALVAWQTSIIPENAIYAKVGPKFFAWISAGLLAIMGAALTYEGVTGGWEHEESGETDWRSLGWLLAGLVLNVALISTLGFIIAGSILFVLTARAFGSTQPLRDAAIGFALALVSYVGFDRLLGYKIGTGLIERLL
ncbi:MAG: tripartite tricarboxylate transporter TctB family protein [Hyphomicrobiaceae bacterium]|nr:tripartite tricarboxylate transporter TctB family protein [Hyphomicrobiaceae bacterium]